MTFHSRWDGPTGHQALWSVAPTAAAHFEALCGAVAARPEWVDLARSTCADAHELSPIRGDGALERGQGRGHAEDLELLRQFFVQFSIDVSRIGARMRRRLSDTLEESLAAAQGHLLAMAWIADFAPRVRVALDRLFSPSAWPIAAEIRIDDATALSREFLVIVHRLHHLDPMTSELVRLLGARAHNCRLCRSLRSKAALDVGGTEREFAAVATYATSDLAPRTKAALALADAMIWRPSRIPEQVVDDIREMFTPEEAVEVVLDVLRNAWNKTTVVAGGDEPHVTDGVEVYEFSDDGAIRYHSRPA